MLTGEESPLKHEVLINYYMNKVFQRINPTTAPLFLECIPPPLTYESTVFSPAFLPY